MVTDLSDYYSNPYYPRPANTPTDDDSAETRWSWFLYYLEERSFIQLRRLNNDPLPDFRWTKDPILSSYTFCNVNRSHDFGSQEFMEVISLMYDVLLHSTDGDIHKGNRFQCYLQTFLMMSIGYRVLGSNPNALIVMQNCLERYASSGAQLYQLPIEMIKSLQEEDRRRTYGGVVSNKRYRPARAPRHRVPWSFKGLLQSWCDPTFQHKLWLFAQDYLVGKDDPSLLEIATVLADVSYEYADGPRFLFAMQEVIKDFDMMHPNLLDSNSHVYLGCGCRGGMKKLQMTPNFNTVVKIYNGLREEMIKRPDSVLTLHNQQPYFWTLNMVEFNLCEFNKFINYYINGRESKKFRSNKMLAMPYMVFMDRGYKRIKRPFITFE